MDQFGVIDTESAFFKLALDSCPDLVFVKSEDLKITYANKAMLELYAPSERHQVIGFTTVEKFSADEARVFLAADYETLEVGRTNRIENMVDYRGQPRVFSVTKTRFMNQLGRPCILGVSTDVTLLVERGDRLRRTNEALERYANNVAHDLASPLGTLSMIGGLIQADMSSHLSEPTQKLLQDGLNIVAGLANQVRALLLVCKAEGTGKIDREPFPLTAIVDRVRTSLSAMLAASRAVIVCDDPYDLDCHPSLIEAVLQNLVENSLKYRSSRRPIIRVERLIENHREVIAVSDNGIGLSADDARRLFTSHAQLDPRSAGAGLGLMMCRNIIELHEGSIWVDETARTGATIKFSLGDSVRAALPRRAARA